MGQPAGFSKAVINNPNLLNNENFDEPFLVLSGIVTQAGTAAPVATLHRNTFGVTPAFARTSAGLYTITCTGMFPANQVQCWISGIIYGGARILRTNDNVITINTETEAEIPTDGLLNATSFKIEVYMKTV